MTNQEILEKAIRKAVEGGWTSKEFKVDRFEVIQPVTSYRIFISFTTELPATDDDPAETRTSTLDYQAVIFNHEFARALWGDTNIEVYGGLWTRGMPKPTTIELHHVPAYLHHLQQMVISDDPIQYLGEHI